MVSAAEEKDSSSATTPTSSSRLLLLPSGGVSIELVTGVVEHSVQLKWFHCYFSRGGA